MGLPLIRISPLHGAPYEGLYSGYVPQAPPSTPPPIPASLYRPLYGAMRYVHVVGTKGETVAHYCTRLSHTINDHIHTYPNEWIWVTGLYGE